LSATKYRDSPEGVSLMGETNNLVKQLVHKTTRTNCNRLKAIKFAVTSCNIICYQSFRVRFRAICGLKSFFVGGLFDSLILTDETFIQ